MYRFASPFSTFPAWDSLSAFDEAIADFHRLVDGVVGRGNGPAINVHADEQQLVITAQVPGVDPKSITLTTVGDTLTLAASRTVDEPANVAWLARERSAWTLNRSLQLPFRIDPADATATVKDGILTVTLKRHAEDKPKAISVAVN